MAKQVGGYSELPPETRARSGLRLQDFEDRAAVASRATKPPLP